MTQLTTADLLHHIAADADAKLRATSVNRSDLKAVQEFLFTQVGGRGLLTLGQKCTRG